VNENEILKFGKEFFLDLPSLIETKKTPLRCGQTWDGASEKTGAEVFGKPYEGYVKHIREL
jgi:hypothetical protein